MNMVRWEPFRELATLHQTIDRLFDDSYVSAPLKEPGAIVAAPAIDIFETEEKVGVKATMPGMKPEDIEINVTPDGLQIKGEHKSETEIKEENYVRRERHYGIFARTIALPPGLKIDKAEASIENGVLTIEIPRADEVKPKTIKIKAKANSEAKKLETREAKN